MGSQITCSARVTGRVPSPRESKTLDHQQSYVILSFSCGNMNFARRTECNRCQEPRPMGMQGRIM